MSVDRLQKIISNVGITSRRAAEKLITDGLVTVNGKVAQLGDKAELGKDAIKVKGKLIQAPQGPIYVAFYKPHNVISMMGDPQGRPSLADYFAHLKTRVFPIGRLDFTSEGLILLTNDGAFAEKLQKFENLIRVYSVKVKGHPDAEKLSRLSRGANRPYSVKLKQVLQNKAIIEIILKGNRAFDLKGLFEDRGFLVEKTTRTAIGHVTLKELTPGKFHLLQASQVQAIFAQPELALRNPNLVSESTHQPLPTLASPIKPVTGSGSRKPAIGKKVGVVVRGAPTRVSAVGRRAMYDSSAGSSRDVASSRQTRSPITPQTKLASVRPTVTSSRTPRSVRSVQPVRAVRPQKTPGALQRTKRHNKSFSRS